MLIAQLEKLSGHQDHPVFVFEQDKEVLGFIAVHYLPQWGFGGDIMIISYLAVEESHQGHGIGKALEEYVIALALKRKCDRVQVHCADFRVLAHKFYEQQGYLEDPKYFTKRLVYAE